MSKVHTTFHGKHIPLDAIDHQHLSNIIWYNTVVLDYPVESCRDFLNELKNNFNGQLLPYRPHVDFYQEHNVLRTKGMLSKDPINHLRVIISGEGKEIGEIICTCPNKRNDIVTPSWNTPVVTPIDYRIQYNPRESKQYHITFEAIRERYKKEVSNRLTLKSMFNLALEGIDEEIKREVEEKKAKEDNSPLFNLGILLRRKNHPMNVYTVQRNGNVVGIYNITHGQWWGGNIPVYLLKDSLKKFVTKAEFTTLCGSHSESNFYAFDEANKLIQK